MELISVYLRKLLGSAEISDFSKKWIENSAADESSIRQIYELLKRYGLSDDKIASRAELLGMNPETIERNYQHHVGLLRQDYRYRTSGRELLTNQAQLLGITPKTITTNVQFLYSLDIDYNDAFLLGTTTQLKRKKMAWMLRELFYYQKAPEEHKRDVIDKLYKFVRENPSLLVKSISSLEKSKDKLRNRAGK